MWVSNTIVIFFIGFIFTALAVLIVTNSPQVSGEITAIYVFIFVVVQGIKWFMKLPNRNKANKNAIGKP
jgi:heme/copper-type cytochrome/quinol oxidase subunit 4